MSRNRKVILEGNEFRVLLSGTLFESGSGRQSPETRTVAKTLLSAVDAARPPVEDQFFIMSELEIEWDKICGCHCHSKKLENEDGMTEHIKTDFCMFHSVGIERKKRAYDEANATYESLESDGSSEHTRHKKLCRTRRNVAKLEFEQARAAIMRLPPNRKFFNAETVVLKVDEEDIECSHDKFIGEIVKQAAGRHNKSGDILAIPVKPGKKQVTLVTISNIMPDGANTITADTKVKIIAK